MIYIELKAANKDKKEENNNENNNPPENDDNKNDEDKKENNQNEENKEEIKEEGEKEENKNEEKKSNEENDNNENKEVEQVNKIIDSNRRITNTDIRDSSTLILEEKECNIFNGEKIKINALGMIGGRGVGDGVVIFGSSANQIEESANMNTGASILKPDFILNLTVKILYPYIFMIYYEKDSKSYFIRPYSSENNDNRILYVKLTNGYNLPLKQKEIISVGNIIFQISPIENNHLEIVNLSQQSLSASPKQTFDPSSKKEVTIGRNKDCDFSFHNNKSFSRIQTTFEFDEENQEWIIIDGSRTKSSTNGTWVFCSHSFPIKDKMIVEVLNNKFQIEEEIKGD